MRLFKKERDKANEKASKKNYKEDKVLLAFGKRDRLPIEMALTAYYDASVD